MKRTREIEKGAAAVAGLLALLSGWSYVQERPYTLFEQQVVDEVAADKSTRIIGDLEYVDVASPLSFFDSRTVAYYVATPYPMHDEAFGIVTVRYNDDPIYNMAVADCPGRKLQLYEEVDSPKQNQTGVFRDFMGDVVESQNGRPFVAVNGESVPEGWLDGICGADWSEARMAATDAALEMR